MKVLNYLLVILVIAGLSLKCSKNDNEVNKQVPIKQKELTQGQQDLQKMKAELFAKGLENQKTIPEFVEMIPYLNRLESYDKNFLTLAYQQALLKKYDSTATSKEDSLVERLKRSIKIIAGEPEKQ